MKRGVATLVVLSLLASCSGSAGPSGGSTPEDVVARLREAAENKDWKTWFLCFDPDKSDDMLTLIIFALGLEYGGSRDVEMATAQALEKHGVKNAEEAGKESLKNVKDKSAFFADFMAVLEMRGKSKPLMRELTDAPLKDVRVESDTATAKALRPDGKALNIRFVRRNNRWYLAVDVP